MGKTDLLRFCLVLRLWCCVLRVHLLSVQNDFQRKLDLCFETPLRKLVAGSAVVAFVALRVEEWGGL